MKLELYKYRSIIPFVQYKLNQNVHTDINQLASEIAAACHAPVAAVYVFIGEIQGFSDEINGSLERIKQFYGYESIV